MTFVVVGKMGVAHALLVSRFHIDIQRTAVLQYKLQRTNPKIFAFSIEQLCRAANT